MRSTGWTLIEGGGYDHGPALRYGVRGRRIRRPSQQHPVYELYRSSRQYRSGNVSYAYDRINESGLARGESEAARMQAGKSCKEGTQRAQGRRERLAVIGVI